MTPTLKKWILSCLTGRRKNLDRTEGEIQHNIQEPQRSSSRRRTTRQVVFEADYRQELASSSALLALPAEIRLQIFEYVIGGHFLHLFLGKKHLIHRKCPFSNFSSNKVDSSTGFQNFSECNYDYSDAEEDYNFAALIKTCRQVYQESIDLLYTTNAFDFRDPIALHHLERTVLPSYLATIRVLQLNWETAYFPVDQDHAAMDSWLDDDFFEGLQAPGSIVLWNRFHVWLWACKIISTKMPELRLLRIRLLFRQRFFVLLRGHIERTLRPLKRCTGLDAFDVVVVPGPHDEQDELNGLEKLVGEMREVVCRRALVS